MSCLTIRMSSCPRCSTVRRSRPITTLTSSPVTVSRAVPGSLPGASSWCSMKPSMSTRGVPLNVTIRTTRTSVRKSGSRSALKSSRSKGPERPILNVI